MKCLMKLDGKSCSAHALLSTGSSPMIDKRHQNKLIGICLVWYLQNSPYCIQQTLKLMYPYSFHASTKKPMAEECLHSD
jgi:hypothetical protein